MDKLKVVAIGGGSGLSTLLRGLKKFPIELTAIVTVTDDGKSSGRLRRDYGILPPGDIRKCLVALSNDEELATKLFDFRFACGRGLSGHNFGNLFLTALSDITGSFEEAIREASHILAINGKVIPATLTNVNIAAELVNGNIALGESNIAILGHRSPIKKVFSVPQTVKGNKEAIDSINKADIIIIGPGSLYTSLIPNLLIRGLTKAIIKNPTNKKIFICNISTERGETEKFTVEDHIDKLLEYSHPELIKYCMVNNKLIRHNGDEGKLGCVYNITTESKNYKGIKILSPDLINEKNPLFHSSEKLADAIEKFF